jgi:hypothetical protein
MQEDEQDGQRADILDEQQIGVEKASAQRSPIGELVAHQFVGQEPANEDAGHETYEGQEYLSCDEVEPVEQRFTKYLQALDGTKRQ